MTSQLQLSQNQWRFENQLPVRVYLSHQPFEKSPALPLGSIEPHESMTIKEFIKDGDILFVTMDHPNQRGVVFQALPPFYFLNHQRNVMIGSVTYDDWSDRSYKNLHGQISGLRFHNYLPWEVDIHFKGNKVVRLPGAPLNQNITAYFDNQMHGFNMDDKFQIYGGWNRDNKKLLYEITIPYPEIYNIYIGKVTS